VGDRGEVERHSKGKEEQTQRCTDFSFLSSSFPSITVSKAHLNILQIKQGMYISSIKERKADLQIYGKAHCHNL
jgi:hypothetical protein